MPMSSHRSQCMVDEADRDKGGSCLEPCIAALCERIGRDWRKLGVEKRVVVAKFKGAA